MNVNGGTIKMTKYISTFLFCVNLRSNIHFVECQEAPSFSEFQFVKNFGRDGDPYSKMTAQFYRNGKYGLDNTFFATYWTPGIQPKIIPERINALIFISHGYAEYLSDDYEEIASHWSQKIGGGALVFGHDHAGHGRTSAGERSLITDLDDFTGPIIDHVKEIQRLTQKDGRILPTFIAAHSMGGLIALHTILKEPQLFDGFIGISPMVKLEPSMATPEKSFLACFLSKVLPSFALPFRVDAIDVTLITRDRRRWQIMNKDPLRYHGGTKARTGCTLLRGTELLQANISKLRLPILVLQAGEDRLVDSRGALILFHGAHSLDKQFKEYPNAYHQLLTEFYDVRDDVKAVTEYWLNKRLVNYKMN